MTKEQVIAAIDTINPMDMGACTEIAEALVQLGVVTDDGENFHPTPLLNEYPASVSKFVAGMCLVNDETRH